MDALPDVSVKLLAKRRKPCSKDPNPDWFWSEIGTILTVTQFKAAHTKWRPKKLSLECNVLEKECKNIQENYFFDESDGKLYRRGKDNSEVHRVCLTRRGLLDQMLKDHSTDHRKPDTMYQTLRQHFFPVVREGLSVMFKTEVSTNILSLRNVTNSITGPHNNPSQSKLYV